MTSAALTTGAYRVGFYDESGAYLREYYDNAASVQTATDVPVTVGSTTGSIDAALADAGHITGTVTAAGGGGPIDNLWVLVYQQVDEGSGLTWDVVGGTSTRYDGTYDVGGLATGTYRVGFEDESGAVLG